MTGNGGIVAKPSSVGACFRPRIPLTIFGRIAVKPEESLVFLFWVPHSCLEYGIEVIGWKKDLVQPNIWSGGTWKSLTFLDFSYVNKSSFLLYFMSIYTFFYVALMVFLSSLLFWLYVGYKHGSISYYNYGSCYVLINWLMVGKL